MAIKFTELVRKGEDGSNWETIGKALFNQGYGQSLQPLANARPFEITEDMFDSDMETWNLQYHGDNITKITIPQHIKYINANINSMNLTEANIYAEAEIANGVLYGCYSLKIVNAPNATRVHSEAFGECQQLEKVKIPQIDTLASSPFVCCYGLKVIDFRGRTLDDIPSASSNPFRDIPSTCKIVVPDRLYNSWITTSPWSSIASQIVKESEYVEE